MDFDVEGARKDGFTDTEIALALGKHLNLDVEGAMKDGFTPRELIDTIAARKANLTPSAPPAPTGPKVLSDEDTSSDFMRGIRNYLPQAQETFGGAQVLAGKLAESVGADETGREWMKSGIERMDKAQAEQVVRASDSLTNAWEKGIGTVLTDWLPYQMGSGVANVAETAATVLAGMGLGALAGGVGAAPGALAGMLSKSLVKEGIKDLAEKIITESVAKGLTKEAAEAAGQKVIQDAAKKALISAGAKAGMVGQAGMHGMGEVTSRAVEEIQKSGAVSTEDVSKQLDLSRVVPAAIAHGIADYFVNKIGLDSLKIGEEATKYLALDIAKRIGVTGLKEVPAEEIQTMAERYGANLSWTDAEAIREYIDTAGAAFGMSVVPGGIGGARTHLSNKYAELAKQNQELADKNKSSQQTTTEIKNLNPQVDPELEKSLKSSFDTTEVPPPPPPPDQGAPSATGTERPAAGSGAEVAGRPVTGESTGESTTPKPSGVGDIGVPTGTTEVGAGTQPTSLATMKPGQQVTLYRGENAQNEADGQWWTTDKSKAEKYGSVTSITLPSEVIGQHAAMGHGGPDEFVFAGKKPSELIAPAQPATPAQPDKVRNIKDRRYELEFMIIDDGLPESHPKVRNKLKSLNQLEQELGLTLSTYDNIAFDEPGEASTLSAKRPTTIKGWLQHWLRTDEKNPSLIAVQNDTHPAYKYDPNLSSKENMQAAMKLAQKYEQEDKQRKETALKESRLKTEARYGLQKGLPKEEQNLLDEFLTQAGLPKDQQQASLLPQAETVQATYNKVREEHNQQAETHNKKREELQKKYKEATTDDEADAISDELEDLGPNQYLLPEWKDLEKDVYFSGIRTDQLGNIYAHRVAADNLINFYKKTRGRSETPLTASEQRIVNAYEDNRREMGKLAGVQFPRWGDLSRAAQIAYLGQIANNAGLQQEQAFFAAGEQIINEKKAVTAEAKAREQKALEQRREEVRKETEKNKAELERLQKMYERFSDTTKFSGGLGYRLTNDVIELLRKGNLQAALEELGNKLSKNSDARNKMAGQIIKLISKLGLRTKIVLSEDRLSNYDLGQYDPKTDTITLDSRYGVSVTVLLHEVLHAASVKVMNLYMTGKKSQLTERQIRGVEQILRIMELTKDQLGATKEIKPDGTVEIIPKDYYHAYENPFEFLAYALSDRFFQAELEAQGILYGKTAGEYEAFSKAFPEEYPPQQEILSILPEDKNMWSAFKRAIAGILNVPIGAMKNYSFLMELNAALEDIASAPIEPVDIGPMSAKKAPPEPKGHEAASLNENDPSYDLKEDQKPHSWWNFFKKRLFTVPGWHQTAADMQNSRYHIKAWERMRDLAGQIYREGEDKLNNIYEQLTLSTGLARNFFAQYISEPSQKLNAAIDAFAKAANKNTNEALNILHRVMEALHEPERRMIKYMMNVPLSTTLKLPNGQSPADRRAEILNLLEDKKLTEAQAKQLRNELNRIVFTLDQNGDIVYKNGLPQPSTYVDPLGFSPRRTDKQKDARLPVEFDNESMYSSTGMSPESVKKITEEYNKHPQKAEIDSVLASMRELNEATKYLNKLSHHWSYPVENFVNFYNWQHYAPFKGKNIEEDKVLDFHSMKRGREMQDMTYAMEGRSTISDNPILQALSDATRSALRAGLKDVTLSVRNAVNQKLIRGEIENIKFKDRKDEFAGGKYKGERTIFHYNEDGSIDVIRVDEKNLLNSIRRTFETAKPLRDMMNTVTSGIGKFHTRYNFQFAPLNFVRDALTNAFAMGADMGPAAAAKFIKDVSTLVVAKNGLYKAMNVAVLYGRDDAKSRAALRQYAETDPYVKSMVEFIEKGGMVSYLQGLSIKSNFQELHKELGRSGIMTKKEQLEKFIDIWTNMFEIASRSAAYKVAKENALKRNETEAAATTRAVAYAKGLANFEEVGNYGKALGAAYMFFRPAATGAVRAIESVAPAFTTLKRAESRLPPDMSPEAKQTYLANYAKLQANSRVMTASLFGLGILAYSMASMTADDDDLGRNAVATDNMEQWTRFARFHIPRKITEAMGIKEPVVFQMPWGFGLGAFMASGAQIAAWFAGRQSFKDAAFNIATQISLDSFVPLPISRMPAGEMPLEFVIDSVIPSVMRPAVEFALNKNGLGQDIYNDRNRRFGDAYTAGDKVPELYKDAARYIVETSPLGKYDITPNTLYFLANSYIDGISRLAELGYGIIDPKDSKPPFNPKNDLVMLNSFFGARSNVDSREFSKVENKILDMEKKIKMFDSDPSGVQSARYDAEYPLNRMLVDMYNKQINGELKALRAEAKRLRLDTMLPAETRRDLVKMYTLQQNIVKRNMIEIFKAYGVEP